ncbi:hypothetical protein [Enterobacter hormaechei]|uniref:hypothetical protein n=1 Tax=Enterobacter hormaechei TaxID=158836 RepID=UPI003C2B3A15
MSLAAMKIALASLEAEQVSINDDMAYAFHHALSDSSLGAEEVEEIKAGLRAAFANVTAPPAPVSDSLLSELLAIAKKAADAADECAHAEWSDDSMEHSTAIADWERRAAMLQGAENAESRCTIQTAPVLDSSPKNAEPRCGSSPVIPDGWVMVPLEPSEHMIVEGFESEPDEFFSDEEVWEAYDAMSGCQQAAHRAKLCWAAMIKAAPKLE